MNKKIPNITVFIILLLTIFMLPQSASQNFTEADNQSFRFFRFNSTTQIIVDDSSGLDDALLPLESVEVGITVKFKVNIQHLANFFLNNRVGKWILFRDGKEVPTATVSLTVENYPDWCTAKIKNNTVKIEEISDTFSEANTKLNISVDEDAIAFQKSNITLKATFIPDDKWGIESSENKIDVEIMTAYISSIDVNLTNFTRKIPPAKSTIIPIEVTNLGNGETTVGISVKNQPDEWNISLDNATMNISIGKTKKIWLNITPIKNFKNETITLKFTPKSTSDASLEGETISFAITLSNDGSLKNEENDLVGVLILIAVIIAIAVIIFVFIWLKRRTP